jgi:quercetin dioxygenase-like cupin family protein
MISNEPTAGAIRLDDVLCWKVLGDDVRHVAAGPRQEWSLFEIRTDGPMGPPPHRHEWEELFLVLEGRLELLDGEQWKEAAPGTLVRIPSGQPHTYRATTVGTRFLALITPGGAEGFFQEIADRVVTMPPDPVMIMAICGRHGVELISAGAA